MCLFASSRLHCEAVFYFSDFFRFLLKKWPIFAANIFLSHCQKIEKMKKRKAFCVHYLLLQEYILLFLMHLDATSLLCPPFSSWLTDEHCQRVLQLKWKWTLKLTLICTSWLCSLFALLPGPKTDRWCSAAAFVKNTFSLCIKLDCCSWGEKSGQTDELGRQVRRGQFKESGGVELQENDHFLAIVSWTSLFLFGRYILGANVELS